MVTRDDDSVFRALADATRRAILDLLRHRPRSVNEIAQAFAVSRPAISKQLRLLREAALVVEEQQGRQRIYRLTPEPLQVVDAWLREYRGRAVAVQTPRVRPARNPERPTGKVIYHREFDPETD